MSSSLSRRLSSLFTTSKTAASRSKTLKPPSTTTDTATTTATTVKPSRQASSVSSRDLKFKIIAKKFKKASNTDNFRHRYYHYESTVRRLAAAKQFSYIEDILEHQKKHKDITNEGFTVRLISLYGKSGMFDHAHKLFDEMPQLNCDRTVMSFNALLAASVNCKKFDKISEFFRELPEKLSIEPDRVSYNTVIKAFCEMDLLDSALLVIDEMEKNGLEPDLITFNTILDGYYRTNRFSDADKLLVLMESKNIVPNVRSYNPKLRGLVADNRISEAIELIEEMRSKGLKPDVYSYNGLIKGFCDDGNLVEAQRWYVEIAKNGCFADRATFAMLLPLVCDKGDFDFALDLCKVAIGRRLLVDRVIMQRVVDGLVKELKIEEAKELVKLGIHYKLKLPTDK